MKLRILYLIIAASLLVAARGAQADEASKAEGRFGFAPASSPKT